MRNITQVGDQLTGGVCPTLGGLRIKLNGISKGRLSLPCPIAYMLVNSKYTCHLVCVHSPVLILMPTAVMRADLLNALRQFTDTQGTRECYVQHENKLFTAFASWQYV